MVVVGSAYTVVLVSVSFGFSGWLTLVLLSGDGESVVIIVFPPVKVTLGNVVFGLSVVVSSGLVPYSYTLNLKGAMPAELPWAWRGTLIFMMLQSTMSAKFILAFRPFSVMDSSGNVMQRECARGSRERKQVRRRSSLGMSDEWLAEVGLEILLVMCLFFRSSCVVL